jgi:hypothetical protein
MAVTLFLGHIDKHRQTFFHIPTVHKAYGNHTEGWLKDVLIHVAMMSSADLSSVFMDGHVCCFFTVYRLPTKQHTNGSLPFSVCRKLAEVVIFR